MKEKLRKIINGIKIKNGDEEIEIIRNESRLLEDLGLDSIDLAELTVKIENDFSIDVFEDGIVSTIGEILERLEK
ncbi:MAG: acyl carrier protein [Candidatus Muiribacterium halophilum]|uniref:Acyl carrier protein n=1 Tax=Muiribacterium halophilum TaxID=2053465 RepID=A0A2N5ZK69_MUIH1|nr:MAG: acyl carrier protein [Candidatus Muirbacterium halophilum]